MSDQEQAKAAFEDGFSQGYDWAKEQAELIRELDEARKLAERYQREVAECEKPMTLSNRQREFTQMVGKLIRFAYLMGYELTLGDAYRSPSYARSRGKMGLKSLHCKRLAIDLNLYIGGKYQRSTKAHEPLGDFWERSGGTWGGRFGDGNHYSLEWKGRK